MLFEESKSNFDLFCFFITFQIWSKLNFYSIKIGHNQNLDYLEGLIFSKIDILATKILKNSANEKLHLLSKSDFREGLFRFGSLYFHVKFLTFDFVVIMSHLLFVHRLLERPRFLQRFDVIINDTLENIRE